MKYAQTEVPKEKAYTLGVREVPKGKYVGKFQATAQSPKGYFYLGPIRDTREQAKMDTIALKGRLYAK